jgi:hypothetical protein
MAWAVFDALFPHSRTPPTCELALGVAGSWNSEDRKTDADVLAQVVKFTLKSSDMKLPNVQPFEKSELITLELSALDKDSFTFSKQHFSHLYVVSRMDEFARTFFRLAHYDEKYSISSDEDSVVLHGSKALLQCFLCWLAYFDKPHAKFEFCFTHLPVIDLPLLSLAILYSLMGSPKKVTLADYSQFSAFSQSSQNGLPQTWYCLSGRLTKDSAGIEVPLLLDLYLNQTHGYDLSNTCSKHKFQLSESDQHRSDIANEILKMSR